MKKLHSVCGQETERYKSGDCIPCKKTYNVGWYMRNAERHTELNDGWRKRNPKARKAIARKSSRSAHRNNWAPGEHERAEAALPFVRHCACCPSTDSHFMHGWIADHNHKTGMFRAHICLSCNTIIGYIEKEHQLAEHHPLQAAYLQRYNKQEQL